MDSYIPYYVYTILTERAATTHDLYPTSFCAVFIGNWYSTQIYATSLIQPAVLLYGVRSYH